MNRQDAKAAKFSGGWNGGECFAGFEQKVTKDAKVGELRRRLRLCRDKFSDESKRGGGEVAERNGEVVVNGVLNRR